MVEIERTFNGIGCLGSENSSDTWLPERRGRYNAKRRQKDLELIFSIWNKALAKSVDSYPVVNIADVPANIAKKYKRALKAHRNDLRRMDAEWEQEWTRNPLIEDIDNLLLEGIDEDELLELHGSYGTPPFSCDKMVPHSMKMLRLLKERIPTDKSKVIVDLSLNFRDSYGK